LPRRAISGILAALFNQRYNVPSGIPHSRDNRDGDTARGPTRRATIRARTVSEYSFIATLRSRPRVQFGGTSGCRQGAATILTEGGRAAAWSRGEHEPSATGRHRRVELLLIPEALPDDLDAADGFADDAEYVYRTHEFEEIEPAPIDEAFTPYTSVARKVAERGLRWLVRGGATVSHHIMVRHIVKRLAWFGKSHFRSGANVRKLCAATLRSADRVTDDATRMVF
jgi:hypothetical protein